MPRALLSTRTRSTVLGYTTANTTTPQPWESSVCLLMALAARRGRQRRQARKTLGVSSSLHDFGPTPNGQMVKALVDGWANPLVLCPLAGLQRAAPNYGLNGTTADQGNSTTPAIPRACWPRFVARQAVPRQYIDHRRGHLHAACHALAQPAGANGDATSYKHFPIIASGGPEQAARLQSERRHVPQTRSRRRRRRPAAPDADDLLATLSPVRRRRTCANHAARRAGGSPSP